MTALLRVPVQYSGWADGPGVNVFHLSPGTLESAFDDTTASAALLGLGSAFAGVQSYVGGGVTITVPDFGEVIDSETGMLQGVAGTSESGSTITGSNGVSNWPPGNAICVTLQTADFVNGRRLRGRFFFGPCRTEVSDQAGNVAGGAINAFNAMMSGLISGSGPRLAVYHRPTSKGGTDGSYGDVVTCRTMPHLSSLRSRRT